MLEESIFHPSDPEIEAIRGCGARIVGTAATLRFVPTAQQVLVVGFDPDSVDFSTPEMVAAHLTADVVLAGIAAEDERIRALGYAVERCHITPDTDLRVVRERLTSNRWDAVLIGAGLRTRPQALLLFEQVINLVHELAPGARIGLPSGPTGAADAVQRWL
ncbi:hypothetical protein ACFYUD_13540 [Nocardia tengchongensis]|uniref:hypothetical protein n=1 Tax=Nocardia tengchongensis TaxID=2055889 RepID=UPI0036AB9030